MSFITYLKRYRKQMNISPTRIIVSSFIVVILFGALLLTLPIASNDGHSIGFLNALFTSTSATCVTGLVIADTLTQWTIFGQLVILTLIQIGGLGLVTLATFFSVLLGKKVSLKGKILAQESTSNYNYKDVLIMIKTIILITAVTEILGALLLSISFIPRYGLRGMYMAIFHSISAFCNAGFDLIGNYQSLTQYNNDPIVLYTIALLIITGGLGFIVWKDLYDFRTQHRLYLHTKIVLIVTAFLILFGSLFFFFSEYSNPLTMGPLTFFQKINAAFFHSVTTRTAGYNSLSLNDMTEVSKIVTIMLMYIGAAPGSTGGGIKVTTFGILVVAILSNIKGNNETVVLRRRVAQEIVNKALSIVGLSAMMIFIVTVIIIGVEKLPFINVLYEVTSAFSTVGLSTGITPTLHPISKMLLIFMMFLGRVGPLTFAIAISMKNNQKLQNAVFPEGKIMVG